MYYFLQDGSVFVLVEIVSLKIMSLDSNQAVNKAHSNVFRDCPLFHLNFSTKSRLRSGNARYHSVQNLLSSSMLSKNLKIKIYRTIILPFVLYGCETWSLTLREEKKLRVFENMVLRRIFGLGGTM